MKKSILVLSSLLFLSLGCFAKPKARQIALFIPGICDNSPTYAMLKAGVEESVAEYNAAGEQQVKLFVMEAGTNQAEWGNQLTALAAAGKYEVIISSNPSIPDLALPVLKKFKKQKFVILDATCAGNPNIRTVSYNQAEQAYLSGYAGALNSKSNKLALIAAQEYPVMNNVILPNFEKGAKAANAASTVEFRVVGNWYDATKGAELTEAVAKKGVDVILPICGGASQGVISSSIANKIKITWFDDDGFAKVPGTVVSSTTMEQVRLSKEMTTEYLEGKTPWGQADTVGVKEGYVRFVDDNPLYVSAVSEANRNKLKKLVDDIKAGNVTIK